MIQGTRTLLACVVVAAAWFTPNESFTMPPAKLPAATDIYGIAVDGVRRVTVPDWSVGNMASSVGMSGMVSARRVLFAASTTTATGATGRFC